MDKIEGVLSKTKGFFSRWSGAMFPKGQCRSFVGGSGPAATTPAGDEAVFFQRMPFSS